MKTSKVLQACVNNNTIQSYKIETVTENGEIVDYQQGSRNTERITITFHNGKSIQIDTYCSGILENVGVFITEK